MGMITLKRNWQLDRQTFEKAFDIFDKAGLPVHLISFVEGTRITRKKLEEVKSLSL